MAFTKTLLADDHALVRTGLRDALASLSGIEIVGEVGNGTDLMDAVVRLRPDLLVMDVNMPDFEPVTAVKKMLAVLPLLKVLVVSAYDDQSYVVGLLSAGVSGYHLKDQPLSDLQLAVERVLDGGRWISGPLVDRLVGYQATAVSASSVLTRRQRELLYMLTKGYNNQKIALAMNLSVKTVENHLTALYRAIGVESRLEANNYANSHPELLLSIEQEQFTKAPVAQAAGGLTVLVVDDNPRFRMQVGKMVSRAHPASSIYEAGDIAGAIRIAEQVKPKLALIDVILDDEDGIQCVRDLKRVSVSTRIILVSAYPDREFRRIGLSSGAIAFLDKKDIDAAAIRQVVEDTLAS